VIADMHTCRHTYIRTHMHTYIHTYMQTYMQTYIHTCRHTRHTHRHTRHADTHTRHADVRTCSHTYVQSCVRADRHVAFDSRVHMCGESSDHVASLARYAVLNKTFRTNVISLLPQMFAAGIHRALGHTTHPFQACGRSASTAMQFHNGDGQTSITANPNGDGQTSITANPSGNQSRASRGEDKDDRWLSRNKQAASMGTQESLSHPVVATEAHNGSIETHSVDDVLTRVMTR
jgi:hypothetical protein